MLPQAFNAAAKKQGFGWPRRMRPAVKWARAPGSKEGSAWDIVENLVDYGVVGMY
jgi:hypothetical protein